LFVKKASKERHYRFKLEDLPTDLKISYFRLYFCARIFKN
jgi:hypothetical protein